MFETLFQMDIIVNIILHTLFVSIPEEFFWVVFVYLLVGEFDYLKYNSTIKFIQSWDYPRVIYPVIITALLSNIVRFSGIDSEFASLVTILSVFVLIVLFGDIGNNAAALKWIGKIFIFVLLTLLLIFVLEFSYMPFILYGTGMTIKQLYNSIVLTILISIPERIVEYSILIFLISNINMINKFNIFKVIFKNKILSLITISLLIIDALYIVFTVKFIVFEQILKNIDLVLRVSIIVFICIFPIFFIFIYLCSIYYLKKMEIKKQIDLSISIQNIIEDIKLNTNTEQKDTILWKLNSYSNSLESINKKLLD